MVERVEKRRIIITSALFITIAILVMLKELPGLRENPLFPFYLAGKFFVISSFVACLLLAVFEVEFVHTAYALIFFCLGLFYTAHGQAFQPNYWLAYLQITAVFPFIFYLEKRLLGALLATGLICFNCVLSLSSAKFIQQGYYSRETFGDIAAGTVILTLISHVIASEFFNERMKKNQISQKFIDLGQNISYIAHDIKGMISGPTTYADLLSQFAPSRTLSTEDVQLIGYLKEDIDSIQHFITEMNSLVSVQIMNKGHPIKVSNVLKSIQKVFRSKIKNIKIERDGDMTLLGRGDYLNSILVNSIINSCEAIHKNKTPNGRVLVFCEDNILGVSDNSGEILDGATLKKLNSTYTTFSSKEQGSGLGILLIKDYISAMGGKFKYYNHAGGVSLRITFPRKILVKQSIQNGAEFNGKPLKHP